MLLHADRSKSMREVRQRQKGTGHDTHNISAKNRVLLDNDSVALAAVKAAYSSDYAMLKSPMAAKLFAATKVARQKHKRL